MRSETKIVAVLIPMVTRLVEDDFSSTHSSQQYMRGTPFRPIRKLLSQCTGYKYHAHTHNESIKRSNGGGDLAGRASLPHRRNILNPYNTINSTRKWKYKLNEHVSHNRGGCLCAGFKIRSGGLKGGYGERAPRGRFGSTHGWDGWWAMGRHGG